MSENNTSILVTEKSFWEKYSFKIVIVVAICSIGWCLYTGNKEERRKQYLIEYTASGLAYSEFKKANRNNTTSVIMIREAVREAGEEYILRQDFSNVINGISILRDFKNGQYFISVDYQDKNKKSHIKHLMVQYFTANGKGYWGKPIGYWRAHPIPYFIDSTQHDTSEVDEDAE